MEPSDPSKEVTVELAMDLQPDLPAPIPNVVPAPVVSEFAPTQAQLLNWQWDTEKLGRASIQLFEDFHKSKYNLRPRNNDNGAAYLSSGGFDQDNDDDYALRSDHEEDYGSSENERPFRKKQRAKKKSTNGSKSTSASVNSSSTIDSAEDVATSDGSPTFRIRKCERCMTLGLTCSLFSPKDSLPCIYCEEAERACVVNVTRYRQSELQLLNEEAKRYTRRSPTKGRRRTRQDESEESSDELPTGYYLVTEEQPDENEKKRQAQEEKRKFQKESSVTTDGETESSHKKESPPRRLPLHTFPSDHPFAKTHEKEVVGEQSPPQTKPFPLHPIASRVALGQDVNGRSAARQPLQSVRRRFAQTIAIRSSFPHPIYLNHMTRGEDDPCEWCKEAAWGLFGISVKYPMVRDWGQTEPYDEISGGHAADGQPPCHMCEDCTLDRIMPMACGNHNFRRIKGLDPATFDYELAYDTLTQRCRLEATIDWCALCVSPAFYCCSQRPNPNLAGIECGLKLCMECHEVVVKNFGGNLQRLMRVCSAQIQKRKAYFPRGMRADASMLRADRKGEVWRQIKGTDG